MRKTGTEMTDERAGEIDKLLADAACRHDRAGEDEVGHCEQRERVELPEHLLGEERHHELRQDRDADEADQRNAEQDRDADKHRPEQERQQEGDHIAASSGGGSAGGGSPATRRNTTNSRYTLPMIIP